MNEKERTDEKMSDEKLQEFMDDCVAMAESLRCMRDKGAESIDCDGVSLTPAVFDRCFPGVEWAPVLVDGEPLGIEIKEAEYRGFRFDAVKDDTV